MDTNKLVFLSTSRKVRMRQDFMKSVIILWKIESQLNVIIINFYKYTWTNCVSACCKMLVPFLKLGNELRTSPLMASREDFHPELNWVIIFPVRDSCARMSKLHLPPWLWISRAASVSMTNFIYNKIKKKIKRVNIKTWAEFFLPALQNVVVKFLQHILHFSL